MKSEGEQLVNKSIKIEQATGNLNNKPTEKFAGNLNKPTENSAGDLNKPTDKSTDGFINVPKPQIDLENEFCPFRDGNRENRTAAAEYVVSMLNEKYINKCSREDIVKWLGDDYEGFTGDSTLSYLVSKEQKGAMVTLKYLELVFNHKNRLTLVAYTKGFELH
jgi:hypothetical protein